MSNFDQWAAPTSKVKASGALFDAGGFDDDPPPASNGQPPANSSFIQASMNNRGVVPGIEVKNSHLLFLDAPPQWQTDSDAPACNTCVAPFDFFIRRHHCRLCGLVFCEECSGRRAMLPLAFKLQDPQRVCADCFYALVPLQAELAETNANSLRHNEVEESGLWRYVNRPVNFSIGGEVRKAAYSVQNLIDGVETYIEDDAYKAKVLMDSEALLFITTAKMAFLGGVKFGTGLLVNRLPGTTTGWSAPCAVGSFGLAFGAIAGVMVTDVIIPLRSADALAHFQKAFSFTLGGEAGFAFGPIGRNGAAEVDASSGGVSTAVSLSNSKGIYGGVTLDGSVIKVRHDINQKFYGREHNVKELLDGSVPCPPAAQPLYDKLREYGEVLNQKKSTARDVAAEQVAQDSGPTPFGDQQQQQQQQQQPQPEANGGGGGGGLGQLWKSWTGGSAQEETNNASGGGGYGGNSMMSASHPPPGGVGGSSNAFGEQAPGGGGQQGAQAAQQAYGAYQNATPEQKAMAYGAAKGAYDSATPEQRAYAFNAAASAVTSSNAPGDVFV